MIGLENDDGVIGELELIELVEQPAHVAIGGVNRLVIELGQVLGVLGVELGQIGDRGIERVERRIVLGRHRAIGLMRFAEVQAQGEGFVLIVFDELDRVFPVERRTVGCDAGMNAVLVAEHHQVQEAGFDEGLAAAEADRVGADEVLDAQQRLLPLLNRHLVLVLR